MISSLHPDGLPDPAALGRLMQSLATIDAILASEDWARVYAFDSQWGDGASMASMRDGCGDEWFALLTRDGVALKGLAHESPIYRADSPPSWIFGGLPDVFRTGLLGEAAFDPGNTTFCLWCLAIDGVWRSSASHDPDAAAQDGSDELLALLSGRPEDTVAFCADYHEVDVALGDIRAIHAHEPITEGLVARLRPDADLASLAEDLRVIGYPAAL